MTGPTEQRLDWLDYARFLSALSVVFFHYLANGPRNGKLSLSGFAPVAQYAEYGYLGVEFFFMVSGFVIMMSARHSTPERFLVSRAVRLWPAFAFCMTATALVRIMWGGPTMEVTWLEYFANLTMVPKKFGQENMDGVYWTLLFEIYFYAAVAILMFAGAVKHFQRIVEVWIGIIIIYVFFDSRPPLLGEHSIFFASGCVLSFIHRDGYSLRNGVALLACLGLGVSLAIDEAVANRAEAHLSPILVAALVTSFFVIFLVFSTKRLVKLRLPAARQIGALTYPIYLLHAYIGYVLLSRFASEESKWTAVLLMVAGVILASYLVNKLVEQLPRRWWTQVFTKLVAYVLEMMQLGLAVARRLALGIFKPASIPVAQR